MISRSLTSKAVEVGGKTAHEYSFNGRRFLVWDGARNVLKVMELLRDGALLPSEKRSVMVQMLFPDTDAALAEDVDALLDSVLWDAAGIDLAGTRESGVQAFDWEQDAGRIKASLRMAYGIDWDDASASMGFIEVCDLLRMLMESDTKTPFQEAVYYRLAKPPKRDKHNGEQVDAWLKRRDHFKLDAREEDTAQTREAEASKAFESLWRWANG